MEEFRKEIIKELEKKLGKEYQIFPHDKTKNNGIIRHGICIHRENEDVSPIAYLEEYILLYVAGEINLEEIADQLIEDCCGADIPRNIADSLKDFGMMKDKVRIKVINHDANAKKLEEIPHRSFLDLAVAYYLDMEMILAGKKAAVAITNALMGEWKVTEEDLYKLGMEKLLRPGACLAVEMVSALRRAAQEGQDEEAKELLAQIEKENGPEAELYAASNRKHFFGACCLLNTPFLQELAESRESDLLIYPLNVDEVLIFPIEKGNKDCMDTKDIQDINRSSVFREERLSNSIYLYDRKKKEVSVYKEGAPL